MKFTKAIDKFIAIASSKQARLWAWPLAVLTILAAWEPVAMWVWDNYQNSAWPFVLMVAVIVIAIVYVASLYAIEGLGFKWLQKKWFTYGYFGSLFTVFLLFLGSSIDPLRMVLGALSLIVVPFLFIAEGVSSLLPLQRILGWHGNDAQFFFVFGTCVVSFPMAYGVLVSLTAYVVNRIKHKKA